MNFIWLTSVPMGDLFGNFRNSGPLGGACFCSTSIPRFGSIAFPRRFLSAPSVMNSF